MDMVAWVAWIIIPAKYPRLFTANGAESANFQVRILPLRDTVYPTRSIPGASFGGKKRLSPRVRAGTQRLDDVWVPGCLAHLPMHNLKNQDIWM